MRREKKALCVTCGNRIDSHDSEYTIVHEHHQSKGYWMIGPDPKGLTSRMAHLICKEYE